MFISYVFHEIVQMKEAEAYFPELKLSLITTIIFLIR